MCLFSLYSAKSPQAAGTLFGTGSRSHASFSLKAGMTSFCPSWVLVPCAEDLLSQTPNAARSSEEKAQKKEGQLCCPVTSDLWPQHPGTAQQESVITLVGGFHTLLPVLALVPSWQQVHTGAQSSRKVRPQAPPPHRVRPRSCCSRARFRALGELGVAGALPASPGRPGL